MTITEVGPHRVMNGNVMDGLAPLMQGEGADLVYSDPPWGQGLLSYWQTLNAKMTGAPPLRIELSDFLDVVLGEIARCAKGYVLLEYGVGWRDMFIEKVEGHGLQHFETVTPSYASGGRLLPYDLHLFGAAGVTPTRIRPGAEARHGLAVVRHVLPDLAVPGGIFLDPCCGLGLMTQTAAENGMYVRGNEINRKRLDKAISRLQRQVKKGQKR